MGDSRLAHQVGTFSSSADDLHTGGILKVLPMRNYPITWSTNVHSIGQGSQVHDTLLEEFLEGHGDTVDDEHYVLSTDRWSVGEDHTVFRGHAVNMCLGLRVVGNNIFP